MAHPTYDNPPVIEAVCEMQFVPGQDWDSTVPGLIYDQLSDDFPEKETRKNVDVRPVQEKSGQGIQHQVEERSIFKNDEESTYIQLSPQTLIINKLKPYGSWDEFKSIIKQAFQAYNEIQEPSGFKELSLRYINKFEVKTATIDLDHYFNIYPETGSGFDEPYSAFITGVQFSREEERDQLRIEIKPQTGEEEQWVMLDLRYILENPEAVKIDDLDTWLETAHNHLWDAFQASITDQAESSFGGENK